MGNFNFGRQSEECLAPELMHADMILINRTAIKTIRVDYGIHNGARSFSQQLKYFLDGASTLDPRIPAKLKAAKHVITEERPLAEAIDIHVAAKFKGKSLMWDAIHLTYVAAYLIAIADILYEQGEITHKLRWGGNWDKDSVIQLDHNFVDNPHLELYIP